MKRQEGPKSADVLRKNEIAGRLIEAIKGFSKLRIGGEYTLEKLIETFNLRLNEGLVEFLKTNAKWGDVEKKPGEPKRYRLLEIFTRPPEKVRTEAKERLVPIRIKKEIKNKYPDLNAYESELYDYLKKTFAEREFAIHDVKFRNSYIRSGRHLFEHLAYLARQRYLEINKVSANNFKYKVKISK